MRVLNIYQVLIYSIPEAIVVTTIAFALVGAKLKWRKVLLVAIPTSLITVTLRPYLGSIVQNILLYYLIITIMLYVSKAASLIESFVGSSVSGAIYLMIEGLKFSVLEAFFGIDHNMSFANEKTAFLIFLIQMIIAIILSIFLNKRKISIFPKKDLAEKGDDNNKKESA